jgi:pimeloyl-ACP methyl ester carboxylesterase
VDYRVAHVRSADGTTVAAGYGGVGYPVLYVPAVFGDLQRYPWDQVREGYQLITADRRGTGMSDGDAPNSPPEVYVDDLQAVVDGLGLERFAIVGETGGVVGAVALAARNPGRASHLVLQAPSENVADWAATPKGRALLSVVEGDWDFFVNAMFRSFNWDSERLGEFALDVADRWTPSRPGESTTACSRSR